MVALESDRTAGSRQDPDGGGGGPICPYLLADEGGWRAARPMPEHRCTARRPPIEIDLGIQRRRCLTEAHRACPAFLAATSERREAMVSSGLRAERVAARRLVALTRPTPTALERPSAVPGPAGLVGNTRRAAEVALIGLMIVAGVVLFAARFAGAGLTGFDSGHPSGGGSAVVGSTATPRTTAQPTPTPTAQPTSTASPTPVPTLSPPPSPTVAATPSPRTYRVQAGDTLIAIAARYGTTPAILQSLNHISDPRSLRIGQILVLP